MSETKAVQETINILLEAAKRCPNPTQKELRVLVAAQGAALHQFSIRLMEEMAAKGKLERRTKLILSVIRESRHCLVAASKINDNPGNSIPDEDEIEIEFPENSEEVISDQVLLESMPEDGSNLDCVVIEHLDNHIDQQ